MDKPRRKNPTGSVPKEGMKRVTMDLPEPTDHKLTSMAQMLRKGKGELAAAYIDAGIAKDEKRIGVKIPWPPPPSLP